MSDFLAIVPAYNEAGAIRRRSEDLHEHAPDFDVLVVDDGSTDDDRRRAPARPARASSQLPFNLGIGGAVQTGYLYALEHGYDVAVQVDGDGQHDARYLPVLLEHLRARPGAQHGHRLALPRRRGRRLPLVRARAGSASGIFARHPLAGSSGRPVTDPTSGFRMCDRRGIELFARDYPHDYPEVEAVLLVHAHRLRGRRGPGADARRARPACRRSTPTQSVYYMIKVLLAIFVGLLRARPDGRAPATAPPSPRSTGSDAMQLRLQIVAIVVTGGLFFVVFELVRRRRLMERYALLWLFSTVAAARPRRSGSDALEQVATRGRHPLRAVRAVRGRARASSSCCCCTSRW